MHSQTPYKFIHSVDDTDYGYGFSNTGQTVLAVVHKVPVKQRIWLFDRVTNRLETLTAMAVPADVMMTISMLACVAPNDDGTIPEDRVVIEDSRSFLQKTLKELLDEGSIDQSTYNSRAWDIKKSETRDELSLFDDLPKVGWTHVASDTNYLMRHSYWAHSDHEEKCLSILDVKYFCSGKNTDNQALIPMDMTTITIPFEFVYKLNKELGE